MGASKTNERRKTNAIVRLSFVSCQYINKVTADEELSQFPALEPEGPRVRVIEKLFIRLC